MKKAWIIGWKDTLVRLYDRGALLYLLLTPLALTFLMGQVFGGSDEGFTLPAIPVAIGNHDEGQLGEALVQVFTRNAAVREVVTATLVQDEAAVRAEVAAGESYCCVVIVPEGFSDAVLRGEPAEVAVYSDPARSLSASVIEGIVGQIVAQMNARSTAVAVTLEQLFATGRLSSAAEAERLGRELGASAQAAPAVALRTVDLSGETRTVEPVAFFAPGIALLFLSFAVTAGARSFLAEEDTGTLARLVVTPTHPAAILGGKMIGIFVTGLLQFGALMLGTVLLFRVRWGDPLAVTLLSLVLVLAFTGLGLLLAVVAKSEGQAATLGTVGSLVLAMFGGTFIRRDALPGFLQTFGRITPNAWGSDAFTQLALGGGLAEIVPALAALLLLTALFFALGLLGYQRRVAR